jgi:peptidoglycan/xylan/chitin deacetylase (PgdA/CDA1 family)
MLKGRINLCFHGVGEPARDLETGEDRYWISTDFFEAVLDRVAARPAAGISFDDGNASDIDIALPALQQRGLRAAFFPVAGRIGRTGSLDQDGIRRLAEAGMTVGTHGMHHRAWRGMSAVDLDEELVLAREVISDCSGAQVVAAACPRGSYDRRVLARLRALGYAEVLTSDRAPAGAGRWLQPRYSITRSDSLSGITELLDGPHSLYSRAPAEARMMAKRWR